MKEYNYQKINKLIRPLMEFMKTEYPNNYQLIIERDFACLNYNHTELTFMRKDKGEE